MPFVDPEGLSLAAQTITLVALGAVLAVSILVDVLARRVGLPRVSLLVLTGVLIAAGARYLFDLDVRQAAEPVAEPLITIALVMVALLLGGDLTLERWRQTGRAVLSLSLAIASSSLVVVGVGLFALGYQLALALPLAAMAVATDPAAVREVVHETSAQDRRGKVMLGIVAIDDAWGIIAFGLAMAALGWVAGGNGWGALVQASWELGGAVLLGLAIGVPAAFLTGRLRPGEPTQTEAVAIILLVAGLAEMLQVSPLLAGITTGVAIANLTRHHSRSLSEIEHIEWPFLVFFFVAAGASADPAAIGGLWPLIVAYLALRLLARFAGFLPATPWLARRDRQELAGIGIGLLPQAGVAMGMALLVAERYPEQADELIAVAVASTIVFEIAGPILTRRVLANR